MDDNFFEKMMELGIGMQVFKQMPSMFDGMLPSSSRQNANDVPPTIPQRSQTFLVVNDTQAGPFSDDDMLKLIKNNLISKDTLVWKSGMAEWQPASLVPDVNKLFIMSKLEQDENK